MIGRFVWERSTPPTLDGVPLRAASLTIEADASRAEVTIRVRADVEKLDLPGATVRVDEETARTLLALGWRAPDETEAGS